MNTSLEARRSARPGSRRKADVPRALPGVNRLLGNPRPDSRTWLTSVAAALLSPQSRFGIRWALGGEPIHEGCHG
jgi:hypothetical protein